MISQELTLFEEMEIDVAFDIDGWRLIPGCEGALGEPVEAFLELFAVSTDDVRSIGSPDDLSRITVSIADISEALEFVRLFTAVETQKLFDKQAAVLEPALHHDHVPATDAKEDPAGFTVERCLVLLDSPGAQRRVVMRKERLSRDGAYELLGEARLAGIDPDQFSLDQLE